MILDELVISTKKRLYQRQKKIPLTKLQDICRQLPPNNKKNIFMARLQQPELAVIAEIKQASPSKGMIVERLPYLKIATEYQQAGVAAISILTEEDHFSGSLAYLEKSAQQVATPILRKDFTLDPYMIYEAKAAGAAVILLIVAILTQQQLEAYLSLADKLGLAAIVEIHNEAELRMALKTSATIIGINNRNLDNFNVDLTTTSRLSSLIPPDRLIISESGIQHPKDAAFLYQTARINGILIGEYLMRSDDKLQAIEELKQVVND
ncbi:MAG: indole-3-glycerol phosphate synthase TrpC [Liquorilactobacillus nagelii]|jgi:indole-3-glycerol phosphate synthase|uniref:indole-3-glycerol phosphate synthase TrpC n=1 Tax=Liquorilactobacillus nagelii TaxID=82688 RepID=UPI0024312581|nr:indole-3-glycerol phosphate synthase TrpC [Liquorilactobacillus nagelii]MCI1633037.1 indole-3-glycerol phosphate synthase TrpC [Liquorilactobacillus nagelii]MCI1921241.1 indole-3-glycerol phosphate synthase TrpC [Liquorilactobacillus nagelii]MCI1975880.1 indole-3-glycerol phosphate synthase TrpC [Liquorilactobacillus nagelii]